MAERRVPRPRTSPRGGAEIHRLCFKLRRTLLHLRANAPTIYRMTTTFLDFRMDGWLEDRERPRKGGRRRATATPTQSEAEAWLRRQLEGLGGGRA